MTGGEVTMLSVWVGDSTGPDCIVVHWKPNLFQARLNGQIAETGVKVAREGAGCPKSVQSSCVLEFRLLRSAATLNFREGLSLTHSTVRKVPAMQRVALALLK